MGGVKTVIVVIKSYEGLNCCILREITDVEDVGNGQVSQYRYVSGCTQLQGHVGTESNDGGKKEIVSHVSVQ